MRSNKHLALALVFIFCLSFIFPAAAGAEETTKTTLGLQEALDSAYENSADIRLAELSVQSAQNSFDDAAKVVYYIPGGGIVEPAEQQLVNNYQQAIISLHLAQKSQDAAKDSVYESVIIAYCTAVKNYNSMENANLALQDLQAQKKISSLANLVGTVSNYDYTQMDTSIKQAEETYQSAKSSYDGSIASLRALLGKSDDWQPDLTTRAVIIKYDRDSLDTEINRGTSESTLVYTKKALLDIENSKKYWTLVNEDTKVKQINLEEASINYDQARLSARTNIEQLYYGIDTLEGQIEAAELAYQSAQDNLKNCQLKYDLGMIAQRSLTSGGESLASAQLTAEKAKVSVENAKIDLASEKAQFAYLTGQTVYDEKDWTVNTPVDTTAK